MARSQLSRSIRSFSFPGKREELVTEAREFIIARAQRRASSLTRSFNHRSLRGGAKIIVIIITSATGSGLLKSRMINFKEE